MSVSEDRTPKRDRPSFVRKVAELTRRERLFSPGSKALVMVSGGQDSITLLHILASGVLGSAGPRALHALHVNYHLRGAESDADEALVVEACTRLGVELMVVHCPVDKAAGNVQEVARQERRAAAERSAAQTGCEVIAVGHTADDQVETLLYRMGRYGGLAAMAGMRPKDLPWVRPLLSVRRHETAAYCQANGLVYACDRGNAYPGYARTGIRESVLPAWEEALPGVVAAACRTAEVAAEMKDLTDLVLQETAAGVVSATVTGGTRGGDEGEVGLSAGALLGLSSAVRRLVLHDWLEKHDTRAASRASVLAIESLLEVSGSAHRSLGGGWWAIKEYDVVSLRQGVDPVRTVPGPVSLPVPGSIEWDGVCVSTEGVKGYHAVDVEREAIIDADSISGELHVRGPEPGDRLRPLGAPGTRKLKEVFVDLKVPAGERARRPLVVDGEGIVWVCGLMVVERVRVTRDTKRYLRLGVTWPGKGAAGCVP